MGLTCGGCAALVRYASGGRGLSCGRYAASLRLTGGAGHRRFAPDASSPAVPTERRSSLTSSSSVGLLLRVGHGVDFENRWTRWSSPAFTRCALRAVKMERVSEALQLPVIVERRRPLAVELEPLEKLNLLRVRRAAQGPVLQESLEPRLFDEVLLRFQFDKLEFLHVPSAQSVVQDDFQGKRREVDVPGFDQRIQERDTVVAGHMEDVRIEELEHEHAHRFITAAAELRHRPEPRFVFQFLLGKSLDHIQQLLGDQALEFTEGLLLEHRAHVSFGAWAALAEDQLAGFPQQRRGLIPQLSLELLLALVVRQLRELPTRQLQELVHLVVDVGAVRRGGRALPREQLGDVGLRHLGGVGEILLLRPELLQSEPNDNRDIHGTPPWCGPAAWQGKLTVTYISDKIPACT